MKNPYSIIKKPLVTEKSTILKSKYTRENYPERREEIPKYTFIVDEKANKVEIRQALEKIFPDIKGRIKKINTMKVKGKTKGHLWRYKIGRRPSWKKAIISLEEGVAISDYEGI